MLLFYLGANDAQGLLEAFQEMVAVHYLEDSRKCLQVLRSEQKNGGKIVCVANITAWTMALPIAEATQVPLILIPPFPPAFPTRDFPPILMSPHPLPYKWMNLASYELVFSLFETTIQNQKDIFRFMEESGASVISVQRLLFRSMFCQFILPYSLKLAPLPSDWGSDKGWRIYPSGFWSEREVRASSVSGHSDQPVDNGLPEFLEAGEPPVYIGWGSIIGDKEKMARLALESLMRCGKRGVLLQGWSQVGSHALNPSDPFEAELISYAKRRVFEIRNPISHAWLFPLCCVVVHHGGAGTTAAALAAGVPQIITPMCADQPFWSYRCQALGVSPTVRGLSLYKVSAIRLASLIETAANSLNNFIQKAQEMGTIIREEKGVEHAVNCIEDILGSENR